MATVKSSPVPAGTQTGAPHLSDLHRKLAAGFIVHRRSIVAIREPTCVAQLVAVITVAPVAVAAQVQDPVAAEETAGSAGCHTDSRVFANVWEIGTLPTNGRLKVCKINLSQPTK
jgi:hypothetical protein